MFTELQKDYFQATWYCVSLMDNVFYYRLPQFPVYSFVRLVLYVRVQVMPPSFLGLSCRRRASGIHQVTISPSLRMLAKDASSPVPFQLGRLFSNVGYTCFTAWYSINPLYTQESAFHQTKMQKKTSAYD